jgi:hypothetical protein
LTPCSRLKHIGTLSNIRSVLGPNALLWCWPGIETEGTGLSYPLADGSGKWVEFHDDPPQSQEEGHEAESSHHVGRDEDGHFRARRNGSGPPTPGKIRDSMDERVDVIV